MAGVRLGGLYKVEYRFGDATGRSVMYARGGRMFGGNSAFAHIGTYREVDGEIVAEISTQRHHDDPNYRAMLGSDVASIAVRGHARDDAFQFEGSSPQAPGVFNAVMRPLREEESPLAGTVGEGGLANGLYAIHIHALDGVAGGNTGVMVMVDGCILGGDAFFYYLGSYSSSEGRWKGEIVSQEHTPADPALSLFGGQEVGMGLSGSCNADGAEAIATAFTGRRSIRFAVTLKLMCRA
ncbi:hypothetical protein X566_23480 [Afipia sp. P52-10]|jgi:hypothetical protein|uniref:GrlR family regulatory protein n=1 Tax=Afipia sp. P52-10 TaxID=1429916 RepID=UPI0003DF1CC8|nr:GrlR family regulatory protein [Afipia sp. P52-10]ETR75645.1 hypothetical protein X566_23480 [Afipia sp. P52-10]